MNSYIYIRMPKFTFSLSLFSLRVDWGTPTAFATNSGKIVRCDIFSKKKKWVEVSHLSYKYKEILQKLTLDFLEN